MNNLVRISLGLAARYARAGIGLAVVLAVGLIVIPAARFAEAAPMAQLGPLETTSGTVVSVSGGVFQLERPSLSTPNTLEQLTVQIPTGATVAVCDLVSLSGHYNIGTKIFIPDTLSKLGSACQKPTASASVPSTAIDSSLDNENQSDADNDNH